MAEQMAKLKCYQNWIVLGLKYAIRKAVTWLKLYEGTKTNQPNKNKTKKKQTINKTPTDFLSRPKEAAWKYTNLDLKAPAEQTHLAYLFIGQSADGIKNKLSKMGEMHDIGKLLNTAWKIYQNKDSIDRNRSQQNRRGDQGKSSNVLKRSTPPLDKGYPQYLN